VKRENGVQEKAGGGASLGSSLKPASLVIAPGFHFHSSGLRKKEFGGETPTDAMGIKR
jgi:hypothetical protein